MEINPDRPGLRSGESQIKPHLVAGLAEVAEVPEGGGGTMAGLEQLEDPTGRRK